MSISTRFQMPVITITTTAGLFLRILEHSDFASGEVDTGFIDRYFTPR